MKWYNKNLKIFCSGPSNKFVLPEIPLRLLMQFWGYVIPDWLDFWIVPFELWILPFFSLIGALTAWKWLWTKFSIFCCEYPLIIYIDQIDIKDLLRMSKRRRMAFWLCSELWKRPTTEMKTETKEDPKQDEVLILFR